MRAWRSALAPALAALLASCGFTDRLNQPGLFIVITPADTALQVGAQFRAWAFMVNDWGDVYRSGHIQFRALDPAIDVTPTGLIVGRAVGRARVVAERGPLADTAWVSVVPQGTIAFGRDSAATVVVMNLDGSNYTEVVPTGGVQGGAPAWLPDGTGLIYQRNTGGLYTAPFVAGGSGTLLNDFGRYPRVSSDGVWVYFWYESNGGQVWRIRTDRSGLERLSALDQTAYLPDPSPDGATVLYAKQRFPADGITDIWRRSSTYAGELLLISNGVTARWSPQGDRIAFWRGDLSGNSGAIFLANAAGGGLQQVSALGRVYQLQTLDWSPDGQWLLVRSTQSLEIINVTSGLTLPLAFSGNTWGGAWRP